VNFLEQVRQAALYDCYLAPDKPLVVGVSGGPDSLALLDALVRLGLSLRVAHFDHQLRAESAAEAAQVAQMAAQRGVPYELGQGDVAAMARAERRSLEESARELRYRFLFDCARRSGAQAVAVAHTADDQVETVLMHLLRGAGLSGLKGMTPISHLPVWDAHIPLARPLLGVWRCDVEAYCQAEGLNPLQDASNQSDDFFRNRLRHTLLPELERYNPQVKASLLRTANALAGDWEALEAVLDQAWAALAVDCRVGRCSVARLTLANLPLGLQRAALRRMATLVRPDLRDLDFASVARAVDFITQPTRSRRLQLPQGLRLEWEEERLALVDGAAPLPFEPSWPQLAAGQAAQLAPGGVAPLAGGWRLRAEVGDPPVDPHAAGPEEAWLDCDALALPLQVRSARVGERFQPLGMGGRSQKLSDFWINARVPHAARAAWPLVCVGERVVWVVGHRMAEWARLQPASRAALHLWMERDA
jgi:tRNA(Ile)-lysidine synthase